jgi:hypothetical protein
MVGQGRQISNSEVAIDWLRFRSFVQNMTTFLMPWRFVTV